MVQYLSEFFRAHVKNCFVAQCAGYSGRFGHVDRHGYFRFRLKGNMVDSHGICPKRYKLYEKELDEN